MLFDVKRFLTSKSFWRQKQIWRQQQIDVNNIFDVNNFWRQNKFDVNNFWRQQIFDVNKILRQQHFDVKQILTSSKFVRQTKNWRQAGRRPAIDTMDTWTMEAKSFSSSVIHRAQQIYRTAQLLVTIRILV